jgi:hypothetical protein
MLLTTMGLVYNLKLMLIVVAKPPVEALIIETETDPLIQFELPSIRYSSPAASVHIPRYLLLALPLVPKFILFISDHAI